MNALTWTRFTWSQTLLSQRVFWQDVAFAIVGALMPIAMGVAPALASRDAATVPNALALSAYLVPAGMAATCLWIVYTTVNSAARRRDVRIYKRLRAAPLPDSSILMGEALSASLPAVVQSLAVMVVGIAFAHAPLPLHPGLLLLSLVLSLAAFSLLSFGISGLLPSGEVATWIVTPFVFGLWFVSGAISPLSTFPQWVQEISPYLPSTAAVEAFRTAYFGRELTSPLLDVPLLGFGQTVVAMARPLLVLAAWSLLGAVAWKRFFRWDPRRSD